MSTTQARGWVVVDGKGRSWGSISMFAGTFGWVEPQFASCFSSEDMAWEVAEWVFETQAVPAVVKEVAW